MLSTEANCYWSMVKAVIFDIDGTLIDSVDLHALAWQETFLHHGIRTDFLAVRSQIGKGGDKLMQVFLSQEQLERWGKRIQAERTELFKRRYLPRVKPFPRLRELFERLRADGIEIALASSAKQDELRAYKKLTGIGPYLSAKVSSDDVAGSKPDPDVFLSARKKLGIDPKEIVAIGDTPYDAESAGKAGMETIGVQSGGWSSADLQAAGCVAVYRDPADLLEKYESSPLAGQGSPSLSKNGYQEKSMDSNNKLYFLMGLGIGALAAILFAPKSGSETRDFLKSKSEEGARYAKEVASDAIELGKQNADQLRRIVAETADSAAEAVEDGMEA